MKFHVFRMDCISKECLILVFFTVFISGYSTSTDCDCVTNSGLNDQNCPYCCCLPESRRDRSSCCEYTAGKNTSKNNNGPATVLEDTFVYFLAALSLIFLISLCVICGFKMTSNVKCADIMRWEPRATRSNISILYRANYLRDNDSTSTEDNEEIPSVEIITPKCPPYAEHPPTYSEVMASASPTEFQIIYTNDGRGLG